LFKFYFIMKFLHWSQFFENWIFHEVKIPYICGEHVDSLAVQTDRFENVPSVMALFDVQACKMHCVDHIWWFSRCFGSYLWPLTTKDFNTQHNFLNQLWQLRLCSNDPRHIAGVMDYGSAWFFSYLALPHLHRQQECRHARRTKLARSRQ
jgi:hypothetical protein